MLNNYNIRLFTLSYWLKLPTIDVISVGMIWNWNSITNYTRRYSDTKEETKYQYSQLTSIIYIIVNKSSIWRVKSEERFERININVTIVTWRPHRILILKTSWINTLGINPLSTAIMTKLSESGSANSNLITHLMIHTGESPYQGRQWDKLLSHDSKFISNLLIHTQEHNRTHTGEKPY